MRRETPPSLRYARQWTQPTDLELPSLSRVVYPPQHADSLSPSPFRHYRTPLKPPLTASSSSSRLHRSATRATRQPLVASPLPTRPSPSPYAEVRRAALQRQPSPLVSSSAAPVQAAVLPNEAAGRAFWQQQAERAEEANAALQRELDGVYRVLKNASTNSSATAVDDSRRGGTERCALRDCAPRSPNHYTHHHTSSEDDSLCVKTVVQQRNMARMELAQEREKNFLLRHRLRETEMEVDRLQQRLRAVDGHHDHGRPAARSSNEKTAPPPPPPKPRRSLSRSTSRTSATSAASSAASARATSRQPRMSSPRQRSVTRRQSSHRSGGAQRRESVSSNESNATDLSEVPRLSRGYARLQHRNDAHRQRTASASASALSSSSSLSSRVGLAAHHSSPLSPAQDAFVGAAPTELKRSTVVAPQREAIARGLLSSLLAARSTPAPKSTLDRQLHRNNVTVTSDPSGNHSSFLKREDEEGAAGNSTVAPRHVFRSHLFSAGGSVADEELRPTNKLVPQDREPGYSEVYETYIARQLVSPTPPLQTRRWSTEVDNLSNGLGPQLSNSGTWMSVSLTTTEDSVSRESSLSDDAQDGRAWPSTYRSFSL